MSSLFRPKLNLYRAKKLDIGSFVNIKVIRDHTKRQVYEAHEAERYALRHFAFCFSTSHAHSCAAILRDANVTRTCLEQTDHWGRSKLFRQALRYIVRNTTLSPRERAEAHIQLAQMHCYMNPTQIRNRCILGGKGRGIFRDFKMSRVSSSSFPWGEQSGGV